MKSEREIRELIAALEQGIAAPCNCAGTEHEGRCRAGLIAMRAVRQNLRWVLGEVADIEVWGPFARSDFN